MGITDKPSVNVIDQPRPRAGVFDRTLWLLLGIKAFRHGSRAPSSKLMLFRAFMACVRIFVVVAILGAIVFVIYDNSRSRPKTANTEIYAVPKAGDTATLNNNAVACPNAADALQIKDLLRTFTDRQPAATYSLEHGCSVLIKSKTFTIRAYSARYAAVCLEVPNQEPCYWTTIDGLTTN
jgi:hypothetical protein